MQNIDTAIICFDLEPRQQSAERMFWNIFQWILVPRDHVIKTARPKGVSQEGEKCDYKVVIISHTGVAATNS